MTPKVHAHEFASFQFEDTDWDRAAFELCFHHDFSTRDLTAEIAACDSIDSASVHLTSTILSVMRSCVPHKPVRIRRFVAWMNKSVAAQIHQKSAAFRKFCTEPTSSNKSKYHNLHKKVRVSVRRPSRSMWFIVLRMLVICPKFGRLFVR